MIARGFILIAFLCGAGLAARADDRMLRRQFADGRVSLLVPSEFRRLPARVVGAKYRTRNAHWLVYGTKTARATVTARLVRSPLATYSLRDASIMLRVAWEERQPGLRWHNNGTRLIGGTLFSLFDIESRAADTTVYNVMAMAIVRRRLLLVTFNMTSSSRDKWLPMPRRSSASIRIEH